MIDVRMVLTEWKRCWIQARALQELFDQDELRSHEEHYQRLLEKCTTQADEKFALLFQAIDQPETFAKSVTDFLATDSKGKPS